MNFKYSMRHDIETKIPTWVLLEIWEILHELNEKSSTEYAEEDIKELISILDNKVNAIQSTAEYQKEHFGKSKYDL